MLKDHLLPPPEISIIIPVFNQLKYTQLCLASISKHTTKNYELIVVDNGSNDNTPMYLADLISRLSNQTKQFPTIQTVRNHANLGFAKAVNQGLRLAQGKYIIVLNNDCIVTEEWTERLIKAASSPKAGLAGVMSNFVSSPQYIRVSINSLEDIPFIGKKLRQKHDGKLIYSTRVVAICMLIKKELIEQIGGFDVRFGLGNFEDDDYSLRSNLSGYQNVIAQDVFVYHFGSVTFKLQNKNLRKKLLKENWQKFKEKWELPMTLPLGSKDYLEYLDLNRFANHEKLYIPLSNEV